MDEDATLISRWGVLPRYTDAFGIVRELTNADIDMQVDEKNVCSIQSGSR